MTGRPMTILQRSASLVQLLADRGALSPAEIAELIDTPRPTVYRLAEALATAGLADIHPGIRIGLSRRWLRLGDAARAAMTEWQGARPILDELASATGQTVFLCVPRGHETVCIDWAQGQRIDVLQLRPGRSLPLHAGAEGRVTLAFGPADAWGYLEQAPFVAFNSRTLVTAEQLRRDAAETRARGYSVSDQDVTDGIGALGAPVMKARKGTLSGALSIAGIAEQFAERRTEFAAVLLEAASKLAATLP